MTEATGERTSDTHVLTITRPVHRTLSGWGSAAGRDRDSRDVGHCGRLISSAEARQRMLALVVEDASTASSGTDEPNSTSTSHAEAVSLLRELSLAAVQLVRRLLDHEPINQAFFIASGGPARLLAMARDPRLRSPVLDVIEKLAVAVPANELELIGPLVQLLAAGEPAPPSPHAGEDPALVRYRQVRVPQRVFFLGGGGVEWSVEEQEKT